MKTVLIIFLLNLANPSEPTKMLHKAFPTEAACNTAFLDLQAKMPVVPTVKVSGFCARVDDLADEDAI